MTSTVRNIEPFRIRTPLPIRTPRLVLRPHREGDGEARAEAIEESWDTLRRWFHEAMEPRATETDPLWQEAVACRFLAQFKLRERLGFLAWSTDDTLVGFFDLNPDWRVGRMRLSYWVRAGLRRRGYAAEAVTALTRYAFEALDARVVSVGHAAPNVASAALIAKLGFERIGVQPLGYEMVDGELVDGVAYAVTNSSSLPALEVDWGADRTPHAAARSLHE